MLVNRRTFISKPGRAEEAANFLKQAMQLTDHARSARVYVSEIGPFDTIAVEVEVESLADYERRFAEWAAKTTPEFWEKWYSLCENGGANEIWRLVD